MASGLLWPEAGFRKVRGHEDLPRLAEALSTLGATRPPQADDSVTTPAAFQNAVQIGLEKSILVKIFTQTSSI